jgi:hypothetical protein
MNVILWVSSIKPRLSREFIFPDLTYSRYANIYCLRGTQNMQCLFWVVRVANGQAAQSIRLQAMVFNFLVNISENLSTCQR